MRVILIGMLLLGTLTTQGQSVGYVTFSPEDRGVGLRSDIGQTYVAMSYGNYYLPYGGYIKDHAKIAVGIVYRQFSLGMAYHSYGEINEVHALTKASLRPISVEAGVRIFVGKRFVAALRYDVLRREGTMDFGFCF